MGCWRWLTPFFYVCSAPGNPVFLLKNNVGSVPSKVFFKLIFIFVQIINPKTKKMKRLSVILLVILFAIPFLPGCSTLKVSYDYDKKVDFNQYKTYQYYGWAKNSDKLLSSLDKERVEDAFVQEFKKRGLTYTKENGDLVVALFFVTKEKSETTANTTGVGAYGGYYGGYYGYGPRWGWGPGFNYSTTTFTSHNYTEGTLIVNVFDAKAKKLIWEGIATDVLKDKPAGQEERIKHAVAKIMENYPVKPVK